MTADRTYLACTPCLKTYPRPRLVLRSRGTQGLKVISMHLLDERLEWPSAQWKSGGRWRLGRGMTVVGPGWWPLVRQVFAAVAELPGAEVLDVKQECGFLQLHVFHAYAGHRAALRALAAAMQEASRRRCEGCGALVPRLEPGRGVWRLHCPDCDAFVKAAGRKAERALWKRIAHKPWPPTFGW